MRFCLPRPLAASTAVGLFAWAQASAFCQNGTPSASQAVVTQDAAYLVGATQMVASADATFDANPQGRYALVIQQERALPPGPYLGKSTTGAVSVSLYDARLNKTRVLLQRRADGGKHTIESVHWLPQTDCALVVVRDIMPPEPVPGSPPVDVNNDVTDTYIPESPGGPPRGTPVNSTLLLYDFSKSLTPRVLDTSDDGFFISVSPNKPLFLVVKKNQEQIGSAPRGVLGPARVSPPHFSFEAWSATGTVYEEKFLTTRATPDAKPEYTRSYYEWDGKSPDAVELKAKPTKAMLAQEPKPAPLPISLQIGALPVPADLSRSRVMTEERALAFAPVTPQTQTAPASPKSATGTKTSAQTSKPQTGTVFHPLYLAPNDPADIPMATPDKNIALLAPDAPSGMILADQSAVLYQFGGAVYAVPLVRVKTAAYAALRKQRAMQQGKQVALGILMYMQDYDEEFPLQGRFEEGVTPYLRDPSLFDGFTFKHPGVPLSKVDMPATTVMGYVTAPGGRAIVYVDGHVKWEDTP